MNIVTIKNFEQTLDNIKDIFSRHDDKQAWVDEFNFMLMSMNDDQFFKDPHTDPRKTL